MTLVADSWLANRGADDQAMYVNLADCDNFDGYQGAGVLESGSYCCLEWMKYSGIWSSSTSPTSAS